jgi:RHS repeat-associated protein
LAGLLKNDFLSLDAVGTNVYAYDSVGQLISEADPIGTVTNGYNNRLRFALGLQQPTGWWTNGFIYDSARRLTNVTSPAGAFNYSYLSGVAGASGYCSKLIRQQTMPNGAAITNNFDSVGRLLGTYLRTSAAVLTNKHEYLYNLAGQRTNETRMDASTVAFGYDNIGQLALADSSVNTEDYGYTYDAAWNLNWRTNNGSTTAFSVNGLNEVTNVSGESAKYDANGNLTNYPNWIAFSYDDENRLVSVVDTFYHIYRSDFVYDGTGRLRQRLDYAWGTGTSPSGPSPLILNHWFVTNTVNYVYDGWRVIQERDVNKTPTVSYTRGLDLSGSLEGAGGIGGLLARSDGYSSGNFTSHAYYHADAGGNITFMLDANQSLVASYRYDPFGNTISKAGTLADANTYRFSSKEIFPNTSSANDAIYYFGYRFYDPYLQRWINRDPIREKGGPNLFSFCRNAPIRHVDALGLTMSFAPGTPPDFERHVLACMCELARSEKGINLLLAASRPGVNIVISADRGSASSGGPSDLRSDSVSIPDVPLSLDPRFPNGVDPNDSEAPPASEMPPQDLRGCAVVLAHELGHASEDAVDEDEGGDNVAANENFVRGDLGLPSRDTYHGFPVLW